MGFFSKTNKPVLSNRLKESGNVFMMLFGAVGMVGVLGASTMTVMKGPVKTMANVTKRTVAENNMIATGKLAIIAAQSNPAPNCDSDPFIEPLPFGTAIPTSGGGTLPASIGVAKQDPWGNNYIYCAWDHGDDSCGSSNLRAGYDGDEEYVLAVISAGPDRNLQTTCHDVADPEATIEMTSGADDMILGYTYKEATAVSGNSIWSEDGTDGAAIARDISIVGDTSGAESFAFDSDSGELTLAGGIPSLKTDNIQSLTALANINLLSPLENSTGVIDIADDVVATGTITGASLAAGTGAITGGSVDVGTGAIDGGAITGTSLDAGTGTIDGGAITGTSLDAGTGTIDGGAITGTSLDAGTGTIDGGATTVTTLNATDSVDFDNSLNVDGTSSLIGSTSVGGSDKDGTFTVTGAPDITGVNTAGEGGLVIQNNAGDASGLKLRIDGNEIQSSSNNAASILYFNRHGGDILIGTAGNSNLSLQSGRVRNLSDPTVAQDAATKNYVDTQISGMDISGAETDPQVGDVSVAGKWCVSDGDSVECNVDAPSGSDNLGNHTATAALNLSTNKIINLADPTVAQDAATKSYVDAAVVAGSDDLGNHTATQNINLGTNKLVGNGGTEGITVEVDGRVAIGSAPWATTALTVGELSTTTETWKNGVTGYAYSWGSDASYNGAVGVSGYGETAATGAGITEAYGIYGKAIGTDDAKTQYLFGVRGEIKSHDTDIAHILSAEDDDDSTGGTAYGLYINLDDTDVTRYGIYQNSVNDNYFAGKVGIGTDSPDSKLTVNGDLLLSNSATLCGVDQKGALRLNATADGLEMCDGISAWNAYAGSGGGSGSGDGDTLADLSCTDGQVAEWDNTGSAWVCATPSGGSGDEIVDADGNTKIQVEEGANDDTIRFDTAGVERMTIENNKIQFFGLDAEPGALNFNSYGDASHESSLYTMTRYRNSRSTPAAVQSGDRIGSLRWKGYDGSDEDTPVAQIEVYAEENYTGTTNRASNMQFYTRDTGDSSPVERMRITSSGMLNFVGLTGAAPTK